MTRQALRLTVLFALTTSLACATAPVASAQDADPMADVEITRKKVTDGIYVLLGRGGNIGLSVGEDGAFLIDDQFAPLTDKIVASVAEVAGDDAGEGAEAIEFMLNTHWHPDHTGGNENLGEAGVLLVAHDNVRKRLKAGLKREDGRTIEPASPEALPVITFSEATTFHWNGQELHAFHVEHAHTDGDTIVHFRGANVVHMGDVFFNGMYPYIDLDSGGSVAGYIAAQKTVLAMIDDDTTLIPGHGAIAGKAELEKAFEMLVTARDRIQKLIDAGKSEEEVVEADPLSDYHEDWATGFMPGERFTRIVYRSLKP